MRLHLHVAGAPGRVDQAVQVWAAFESSVGLPFSYHGRITPGTCDETEHSEWAECSYSDGIATIRVTPRLLDAPAIEQTLTLLHESLHIASFAGSLKPMCAEVTRFRNQYQIECNIAQWLASHLFEVDAEFALRSRYPAYVSERANFCFRLQQQGGGGCIRRRSVSYRVRPTVDHTAASSLRLVNRLS